MKIKTNELTGPALDWAVAKCEGHTGLWIEDDLHGNHISRPYTPSTDWSQGGPIIEREGVEIRYGGTWQASFCFENDHVTRFNGPTPLIAATRCYVASKLGDEVDVPEGLLK